MCNDIHNDRDWLNQKYVYLHMTTSMSESKMKNDNSQ